MENNLCVKFRLFGTHHTNFLPSVFFANVNQGYISKLNEMEYNLGVKFRLFGTYHTMSFPGSSSLMLISSERSGKALYSVFPLL